MIFHENRLPSDDSHEISYHIFFEKSGKMSKELISAAVVISALRVSQTFSSFLVKSQFSVFLLHCSWEGCFKGVCDYSAVPL